MIKKVDHIAIAVKDIDEEIKRYKEILGFKFLGTEVVQESHKLHRLVQFQYTLPNMFE